MTVETLFAAMKIPERCKLGKRLFKKHFHEYGNLGAADRKALTEDVDGLLWQYTLKPTTIPIPAYADAEREYPEVAVIQVDLKRTGRVQRLAEIVHRTIPYPMILAFASEDGVAVSLAHKRFSRSEADAVVAEGFQTTGWFDPERAEGPTAEFLASLDVGGWPHTNFLAFYEAAMARVVALGCAGVTGRFEIGVPESAEARRERLARCHELENRIRDLRGKIRKETQFNRQVDLNMEIQNLEREREGLKNEL